jgi:hypothetical protein
MIEEEEVKVGGGGGYGGEGGGEGGGGGGRQLQCTNCKRAFVQGIGVVMNLCEI